MLGKTGPDTERLQPYFTANDVTDAGKQRAILLSVCGAPTYQLIRNLVAPQRPIEKSFAEIVKLMSDHYQPKPSPITDTSITYSLDEIV